MQKKFEPFEKKERMYLLEAKTNIFKNMMNHDKFTNQILYLKNLIRQMSF